MGVLDVGGRPVVLTSVLSALVLVPAAYYVYQAAVYVYVKKVKIGKVVDRFQGPKKHWFFGHLHQHPGANEASLAWWIGMANEYRTSFRMWYGPFISLVACVHPSTAKTVLRSTQPKQTDGTYGMIKPWLGDGLLLSSGDKWFRNRKLLTPAFHFDVLKPYMKIYNEAADIFLDKLGAASKSGSVEITRPITLLTLNVILRCAFSSDMDVQREGESHPYVNAVMDLTRLLIKRVFNPLVHSDIIYSLTSNGRLWKKQTAVVHGVSTDVIAKRKIALRNNPEDAKKRYLDFLDILLVARDEDDRGLTDSEIRDEVDTFLFEGHDTTASAISWMLYEMARNPDHQQTCREEVEQFMSNRETKDVDWDDLSQLRFMSQCIKEALRMHSPVPFIHRQVDTEFELDGITVVPGTFLEVSIVAMNHNEHVWGPDHLEFKPERFNHGRMEHMDSFAFVPFSAGPRNCIGQNFALNEIKVVIAKALYRFTLTVDTNHKVEHIPHVVMRTANGIKLFLEPRLPVS